MRASLTLFGLVWCLAWCSEALRSSSPPAAFSRAWLGQHGAGRPTLGVVARAAASDADVLPTVERWVHQHVIKLNLCPYAKVGNGWHRPQPLRRRRPKQRQR